MIVAVKNGNIDVINQMLVKLDIDINQVEPNYVIYADHLSWIQDSDGMTALMWSVQMGHTEVVDALLAHPSINVNQADSDGRTSLYWAAYWGKTEVADALLAHKAIDVNKADHDGNTPLMMAVSEVHPGMVNTLLTHKNIDVNKADRDGNTPLMWAVRDNRTTNHTRMVYAIKKYEERRMDKNNLKGRLELAIINSQKAYKNDEAPGISDRVLGNNDICHLIMEYL